MESQTVSWPGLGGGRHTEQTEIAQQKNEIFACRSNYIEND